MRLLPFAGVTTHHAGMRSWSSAAGRPGHQQILREVDIAEWASNAAELHDGAGELHRWATCTGRLGGGGEEGSWRKQAATCGIGAREKGAALVDLVRENSFGCPALTITMAVERELVQLCRDFAYRRHHRVRPHRPEASHSRYRRALHPACLLRQIDIQTEEKIHT
jgi:hypothetical protein